MTNTLLETIHARHAAARHDLWHKMNDRERRIVEAIKQNQERNKK